MQQLSCKLTFLKDGSLATETIVENKNFWCWKYKFLFLFHSTFTLLTFFVYSESKKYNLVLFILKTEN